MMPRAKQRKSALADLGIPLTLAPMEALLVAELPKAPGWQFEPKWDGFRCLAFRAKGEVEIKAKSGKSLSRFFPEVLGNLRAPSTQQFVLDGELVVPVGGNLSFDALQMRLHPAESLASDGWLGKRPQSSLLLIVCCASRGSRSSKDRRRAQ